ncbi:hypothetical protein ACFWPH_28305 [Nocardia sp. NPDC058499]|uniref:hypothetical protein n=1 Tax=Nocardia sp. NPDC058499 TaxID=3346530 RepID=UPI003666FBB3
MSSKDERGQVVEVLRGHTTADTAVSVDDYPYGRLLRTTRRCWVETASKGAKKDHQRLVTQTLNPKSGRWNNPHPGGYAHTVFLVRYENGHVDGIAGPFWDYRQWVRFWLTGIWSHLNESERKTSAFVQHALARRDPTGWQRWFTLGDRMKAQELPPLDRLDLGDLQMYLDESDYADLRRYLQLGGPDLRVKGWFEPGASAS